MNNGLTKNILWRFAERFLAQIITFVVSIVLARLLIPEDYGIVALVNVFIIFADVFVESGFSSALIQKKDSDDLDFSTVLFFNIGFSIVWYLVLFFTAPFISRFYENDLLTPIIRVLAIRVVLAAVNSIQQAYISKKMLFKKFFWATLTGTITSGVVGILFAVKGLGVWALVAQYLINIFIDTLFLLFIIQWKPIAAFSLERLKRLFRYGWKILFEGLAATLSTQIRNLIIGKAYTDSDLGYYNRGEQFPGLIMNNVNTSINSVLFPSMSVVQDDDNQLINLMRKSVRLTSYILFPMLFGLSAVAYNLVLVLLGNKWIECIPFIYIACTFHFLTVGMYPRHQAMKAKGHSGVFMVEHIVSRTIGLVLLFLVYKISVFLIALSGIVSSSILFAILMYTSKKYTGYRYRDQIKDVAGLIIISVLMFCPVFFFGLLIQWNPVLELVIQVIMGATIYLGLSRGFKPEGFVFVSGLVGGLFKKSKGEESKV